MSLLPLVAGHLPYEPPEFTRPVDEVQMITALQCAFVFAPLAASYADQSVVIAFNALYNAVRLSKHGPEPGLDRRAVRVVPVYMINSLSDPVTMGDGHRIPSRSGVFGLKLFCIYSCVSCENAPVSRPKVSSIL